MRALLPCLAAMLCGIATAGVSGGVDTIPVSCAGEGLRFVSCRMTDGARTDALVPQPTAVPPTGFCVMAFDVCRDETAKGERK